jgi:putative ATPase
MRPQTLEEFIGQNHLVGDGRILRQMIKSGSISSMIFWGPPGTGKTTLAHIIVKATNADFYKLSGVTSGKSDLTKIIESAEKSHKKTVLFIDEIHRWNKAQQDVLLPFVENGLITLIGATTENPSFEVIGALLSRCRVFVLKSLNPEELEKIIDNALKNKERGIGKYKKTLNKDAKELLVRLSGGDARIILNALEIAIQQYNNKTINPNIIAEVFQTKSTSLYDKKAEEHYNTISAFIKSMRASDPDAALHYLARMVDGGEDPKFIARRMVIFASEDIGMAQPTALVVANEVFRACETIGYPECAINLAHGVVYLATAKKSRASYDAYAEAMADVKNYPNEPIPLHLRNAPTKLMKSLGYAKGYSWQQGQVGPQKNLSLLPEKLKGKKYYKK